MKLGRPLLLAALLISSCVGTHKAPAKGRPPAPEPGALLWTVSKGADTAWLFGSIHLATPDMYPLPAVAEAAFARSSALGVEVAIDSLPPEEVARDMWAEAFYPAGDSLPAHLPDSLVRKFHAILDSMGLPTADFDRMRPWAASLQLASLALGDLEMDPELGIDRHFLKQARAVGKPVLGLESVADQGAIFKGLDDSTEARMFAWNLSEIEGIDTMVGAIVNAWKSGDAAALEGLLFGEEFSHPAFREMRERIYTRRNLRMADSVATWVSGKRRAFVVVGAAHLLGSEGVPALLAARGYQIGASQIQR